ncbi:MAG: hypothetical protein ABSE41_15700 [Bacteroidota bacterium]
MELSHEVSPTVQLSDNTKWRLSGSEWPEFFDSCTVEEGPCWSFTPGMEMDDPETRAHSPRVKLSHEVSPTVQLSDNRG